jgi:hypothetical protein
MEQQFIQHLVTHGHLPSDRCEELKAQVRHNHTPIGMIAMAYALLSLDQIDEALDRQQVTRERFGEAAVSLGAITSEQVEWLLKVQRFRRASSVVEAATLSGMLRFEDAASLFGEFLRRVSESEPARDCGVLI